MSTRTFDLRGEDTGETVVLNKRDFRFYLEMVVATCDGNFGPTQMKEWTLTTLAQVLEKAELERAKLGGRS